MFRIISKGRLRKLSVHQRNRICIICGLSRCSGCSDRCGWSLLYSKWQVGGKIYSTTNYIKNRYGQKLSAYDIPIIFLTSAADYALPAFSVHAARYLLKPVNKRELDEAVDFIMSSLSQKHPQPVILRTSEGYVTVLRDSIVFFETQRNCTICHCGDGQIVRTVISMSDTAELVASMPEFIRVGASFIINFTKIRSFDKKNIAMANGDVIPIPRRAYPELRQAYVDYYCEN